MPPPSPPALQKLHCLDGSSPNFHDQLSSALYGQEYKQCVRNLQDNDLVWLVDYLDKALNFLHPSSAAFRKCLRELRSICSTRATLPTSYTLSSDLLNIDPDPFASGGYGDVYEGTLDGSKVCIKRLRVYTKGGPRKATRAFCQEAVMWKRLTHPNIVHLLGVTLTPLQLISDWMSGGDLPEYIEKYPDADRLGLLSDVAKGLHYLHSCNVIHGDLKGPNVLVDDSGHARIGDFGLATVNADVDSERSVSADRVHATRWTAPEVLNEGTHSKEADIFSFGMVMIEVFTGAIPFSNGSSVMAMLAITQGRRPPRPTHPTFTESLWELMQRCWEPDPLSRPEVSEALQVLLNPEDPSWKQLISHAHSTHERISLITSIFSDRNQVEVVGHLSGDDAQAFIDVIDEALDSLPQQIRKTCLRFLYRICGRQARLPKSLPIPLCYDLTETPHCHGGFADVWKGQHNGQDVAAKALRVCLASDFERIRKRFCKEVVVWKTFRHPNVVPLLGVTMTENRFVMVSEWMDNGNINAFVKAHPDVNRLELLADITKGLIYMHDRGIVHGDLKGANILIDNNGRACISDFSLLTIISDQQTFLSTCIEGGTAPWMSPELLDPESFGLKRSRLTRESDCYALGMVIYEILSGRAPFSPSNAPVLKVLRGDRPERPQGAQGASFTDGIWGMLELCWKPQPSERISAKVVLLYLEGTPSVSQSSSPDLDGKMETETDDQSDTTTNESVPHGEKELPDLPHNRPLSTASSRPGSRVSRRDSGLSVPPRGSPSVPTLIISRNGGQLLDQPQPGNPGEGGVGNRLARKARKILKATTKKLHGH